MTSIRVLIVDDMAQVRRDLRTVLPLAGQAAGLQIEIVGEAGNGQEAIQRAAALEPDVVLMDLEMPVMGGYEATRQIKAHCPACRVIALTVHGYEAARQQAIQAGVDDFIVKGAPVDSLVQAISERKGVTQWTTRIFKEDTTLTGCVYWPFSLSLFFTPPAFSTWGIGTSRTPPRILRWRSGIVFASSWLMPFVFVISGASLFYAVGKSGAGQFIKDKVLRLLVPLVVGVFTHVAFQVYLERITHGQFSGSFFDFLPHYFEGIYGLGGNFAFHGMHLWYLLVLFVFSIVLLPLFLLLKSKMGSRVLGKLMDLVALPGLVYVLALIILLSWKLIDRNSLLGFDKFDWNLGVYMSFFLFGFVIMASERLQQSIQRLRWISLLGAITMTVMLIMGRQSSMT